MGRTGNFTRGYISSDFHFLLGSVVSGRHGVRGIFIFPKFTSFMHAETNKVPRRRTIPFISAGRRTRRTCLSMMTKAVQPRSDLADLRDPDGRVDLSAWYPRGTIAKVPSLTHLSGR
jgi:hypothetical protein